MDAKTKLSPGLALAISERLLHWSNGEELHLIQRLIWKLQAVIDYQDLLRWDNFCFGLVRKILQLYNSNFWKIRGTNHWVRCG